MQIIFKPLHYRIKDSDNIKELQSKCCKAPVFATITGEMLCSKCETILEGLE
jgi:hypothetical protein